VDREAAARYGLRVQDVNDIIESAIGGNTIAMTVEGRERYPINVRYARDFRDDLDSLKRVLVPMPTGAQVPISMLAEISNKTGPPSIRNENAHLVGFVFVGITTADIGGYVKVASERIGKRVRFPPRYSSSRQGSSSILRPPRNASRSSFPSTRNQADRRWLNRTVLGIELASLSSDWSRCLLSFGYCNGCICHGQSLPDHRPLSRQPCADQARG
jgi:Cu(I)/Ag(I) efflux system membrane protein CusA/SilA